METWHLFFIIVLTYITAFVTGGIINEMSDKVSGTVTASFIIATILMAYGVYKIIYEIIKLTGG